jgi:hypothetical protein
MKKIWIVAVILCIGVLFSIIVFNIYNTKKRDIRLENVDFKVSSKELFNEFEKDESNANKKYTSKVIEIKGKIAEILKTEDNETMFILKEENEIYGINCAIIDKKIKSKNYNVGDSITIKGIVQGYLTDVIVNNCIIIK